MPHQKQWLNLFSLGYILLVSHLRFHCFLSARKNRRPKRKREFLSSLPEDDGLLHPSLSLFNKDQARGAKQFFYIFYSMQNDLSCLIAQQLVVIELRFGNRQKIKLLYFCDRDLFYKQGLNRKVRIWQQEFSNWLKFGTLEL